MDDFVDLFQKDSGNKNPSLWPQVSSLRARPPASGLQPLLLFSSLTPLPKAESIIKKPSPDDGGDDCFAHVKDSPALENCQKGDSVNFDKVWDDRKGKYKAENVSGGSGGGGGGGW